MKSLFSKSLEDELNWKPWLAVSGRKIDTRKKLPKVWLRQWWAGKRVGSGAAFSGAD